MFLSRARCGPTDPSKGFFVQKSPENVLGEPGLDAPCSLNAGETIWVAKATVTAEKLEGVHPNFRSVEHWLAQLPNFQFFQIDPSDFAFLPTLTLKNLGSSVSNAIFSVLEALTPEHLRFSLNTASLVPGSENSKFLQPVGPWVPCLVS